MKNPFIDHYHYRTIGTLLRHYTVSADSHKYFTLPTVDQSIWYQSIRNMSRQSNVLPSRKRSYSLFRRKWCIFNVSSCGHYFCITFTTSQRTSPIFLDRNDTWSGKKHNIKRRLKLSKLLIVYLCFPSSFSLFWFEEIRKSESASGA